MIDVLLGIMLKAKGLSNHKWILATNVYASATKFLWLKNSWDSISFMIIVVTYDYIMTKTVYSHMSLFNSQIN